MVSEPEDEEEKTDDARTGFPRILMTFGLDHDQRRTEICCTMRVAAHDEPFGLVALAWI